MMEPVRAWKLVQLNPILHDKPFRGITFGEYAAEARFECFCADKAHLGWPYMAWGVQNEATHATPVKDREWRNVGKGCGFYAMKFPNDLQDLLQENYGDGTIQSCFLAEVELYGHIIEHQLGYRAEYQRVLRVSSLSTDREYFLYDDGESSRSTGIYAMRKSDGHKMPEGFTLLASVFRQPVALSSYDHFAVSVRSRGRKLFRADITALIGAEFAG